jgi:hypothetical protein
MFRCFPELAAKRQCSGASGDYVWKNLDESSSLLSVR